MPAVSRETAGIVFLAQTGDNLVVKVRLLPELYEVKSLYAQCGFFCLSAFINYKYGPLILAFCRLGRIATLCI
jgi:hypothetical protein